MESEYVRHLVEGVIGFARKVESKERGKGSFMIYQFPSRGRQGIGAIEVTDFEGKTDFKEGDKVSLVVEPNVSFKEPGKIKYNFVSINGNGVGKAGVPKI